MSAPRDTIRIDKWLWHARFFKTRGLATKTVAAGKVRVDGTHVSKPARMVGAGDVLTFAKEREVKVVKIAAIGARRGPASEAQALYEDLSPVPVVDLVKKQNAGAPNPRFEGKGRPNRKERATLAAQKRDIGSSSLE